MSKVLAAKETEGEGPNATDTNHDVRKKEKSNKKKPTEEFRLGTKVVRMREDVFRRHFRFQSGEKRKKVMYTEEEVERLREGVRKYGKTKSGRYRWSKILADGGFQPGRTVSA